VAKPKHPQRLPLLFSGDFLDGKNCSSPPYRDS